MTNQALEDLNTRYLFNEIDTGLYLSEVKRILREIAKENTKKFPVKKPTS